MSLALVLFLDKVGMRGAVMISILATSVFCHLFGIGWGVEKATRISTAMFSGIGQMAPGIILDRRAPSVILILFLIDFYGSVAKLIGLTSNTNIAIAGRLPRIKEALLIDSVGTTVGSALGTSSITVYVESGVGIGAGGRTGLTAVVCGMLILSCFGLAPLLHYVPVVATTGALVFVAIKLCPPLPELRCFSGVDLFAVAIMQILVIATFAIDRAMLAGFSVYIVIDLVRRRRPNSYVLISTILLAVGAGLQG
jgi:AGZA family xanthine/uracil permease-like MFS transporter